MRRLCRAALAWWLWRQVLAGQMLDRNTSGNNLVNWILQAFFCQSNTTATTFTPGTGGGSAKVITPPYKLLLETANGTSTANGTQLTGATGYTAGGTSMGTPAFGTPSAGIILGPPAVVQWTNSGGSAWTAVSGIEIWDSAATSLRWLFGALTGGAVTVNAGNTLQFAANSISVSGANW